MLRKFAHTTHTHSYTRKATISPKSTLSSHSAKLKFDKQN